MTTFGREIRSVVSVGLLVGGIAFAVPRGVIGFKAREVPAVRAASAAFVALTDEETSAALGAAKTAWQAEASAPQRMRVQLPLGDLPEDDLVRPFALNPRRPSVAPEPIAYPPSAYRPSCAAAAPEPRAVEPGRPAPAAFTREELLGISN